MPETNISPPTDDETAGERSDGSATGEAEHQGEPGRESVTENGGAAAGAAAGSASEAEPASGEEAGEEPAEEPGEEDTAAERTGLTPRQARRVRIIVSGVVMVAVAVTLVVRLGSAPSVLTMGFYGIALILSGTAIVLSRRGRTRVATGVLALGFAAVALAEWLLASVQ
ncbi:hypothetical protein [Streptomyces nanshensis]|uniref:hypothetical protein n=1 Tax=Streptomyces nanshensis TaxID=518642 RepID=UPI000B07CE09|nr:hypothetical protein [Streptomyces nanshensis]